MLISPFFMSVLSHLALPYPPPDRRTFERRRTLRMQRGSGKVKRMKTIRKTLPSSLLLAVRERKLEVRYINLGCYDGSSLVGKCFASFESKLSYYNKGLKLLSMN